MNAAAVMVEILVIGVQAWVAMMLWALGYLGHGVVLKPLSLLAVHGGAWKWLPVLVVVLLSACYTLGIMADRVARVLFDRLIRPALRRIFNSALLRPLAARERLIRMVAPIIEQDEVLVQALYQEKGLSAHLLEQRMRIRIARATLLNSALIWTAFWFSPQLKQLLPLSPPTSCFVTAIGVLFLALWIFFWAVQDITYRTRLEQARRVMGGKSR